MRSQVFFSLNKSRRHRSSLSGAPHRSRQMCSKARYEAKEAAVEVRRQRHDIRLLGQRKRCSTFPNSIMDLMSSVRLGCDAAVEKLEKIAKPGGCRRETGTKSECGRGTSLYAETACWIGVNMQSNIDASNSNGVSLIQRTSATKLNRSQLLYD